MALLAEHLEHA